MHMTKTLTKCMRARPQRDLRGNKNVPLPTVDHHPRSTPRRRRRRRISTNSASRRTRAKRSSAREHKDDRSITEMARLYRQQGNSGSSRRSRSGPAASEEIRAHQPHADGQVRPEGLGVMRGWPPRASRPSFSASFRAGAQASRARASRAGFAGTLRAARTILICTLRTTGSAAQPMNTWRCHRGRPR
jgi:hypothetical protein